MSSNNATESRIQQSIFVYYQNTYCRIGLPNRCMVWHTPNENQHRLTHIGVLTGVADLTLIHSIPGVQASATIYIEVKTPTGKQSEAQADFMHRVRALGYEYHVVRSLDEFITALRACEFAMLQNKCNSQERC